MPTNLLPKFVLENYELHEWKHACAILKNDFPCEWNDIIDLLMRFRFKKSWIDIGGGSKSKVACAIDEFLLNRGWVEKNFSTKMVVDESEIETPTHKVDCFKCNVLARCLHFMILKLPDR